MSKVTITLEDDLATKTHENVRVLVTLENGDIIELDKVIGQKAALLLIKKRHSGMATAAEGLSMLALAGIANGHRQSSFDDRKIVLPFNRDL